MTRFLLLPLLPFVEVASSCSWQGPELEVTSEVINPDCIGLGVEWDPYDEVPAWGYEISEEDWRKLYSRLDAMRPSFVRCMINSPFLYYDSTDGTFHPERNSSSITRLLSYCQKNSIRVLFGEFNPPTWSMRESWEWIEYSVKYLNFLVEEKGFTCITDFIIYNEPDGDWASTNGDWGLYLRMLGRFRSEMDKYPALSDGKVSLCGPDVVLNYRNPASPYDDKGWVERSVQDASDLISLYEIHAYPGQHEVRSGELASRLREIVPLIPEGKKIVLGEAGFKYDNPDDTLLMEKHLGRVEEIPFTKGTDSNLLVYDYFYGLDMSLLAMECLNNGLGGLAVWMLDDAMHTKNDSGVPEDLKIWGFWNILGEEAFGKADEEKVRPFYYTWSLMSRYFPRGCDILKCNIPEGIPGINVLAASLGDEKSVCILNISEESRSLSIRMQSPFENASQYLYTQREDYENISPVKTGINGSTIRAEIPPGSLILISDMR